MRVVYRRAKATCNSDIIMFAMTLQMMWTIWAHLNNLRINNLFQYNIGILG